MSSPTGNEPLDHDVPVTTEPTTTETPAAAPETPAAEPAADQAELSLADTSGTGTIVALGCIAGTVFLIVLGVIYLLITQLLG